MIKNYIHVAILLQDNKWINIVLSHDRSLYINDMEGDSSWENVTLKDAEKRVKYLIDNGKIFNNTDGIRPIILGIVAYKLESCKNSNYNNIYELDAEK